MRLNKKLAISFAAVLLILAPLAVTAFAQPSGPGIGKESGYFRTFVEPIIIGHGFALNGNEYHILDVNAIKMSDVSSSSIRSLLTQNKTRAEIATDIRNYMQNAPAKTRGNLRFAGQAYALNITSYDNQSLSGNVLTLPPRGTNHTGFTPTTVGSISLSMSKYEGVMLSKGTLTMNNTSYNVLLTSPVMKSGGPNGMFGLHKFNGMFGQHNSKR